MRITIDQNFWGDLSYYAIRHDIYKLAQEYESAAGHKIWNMEKMKNVEILEPMVELITPEMSLHWARWGPENDKKVIDEVPVTGDGAYRYWLKRVDRLRNTVMVYRPYRLWGMVQEQFQLSNQQMINYFGPRPADPDQNK